MAYINLDSRIAANVKAENLIASLNSIIDQELAKDVSQVNTTLVNECVDAIISLEQEENNLMALVPLVSSKEFLKQINAGNDVKSAWKRMSVFTRAGIVAAVVASTTFAANAAVMSATGVNIMETVGETIQDTLKEWGVIRPSGGIDIIDGEDDDGDEVDEVSTTNETTTQKVEEIVSTTNETTTTTTTTTIKPVTRTHHIDIIDGEDDDDEPETKPTTTETTTKKPPKPTTVDNPVVRPTNPTTKPSGSNGNNGGGNNNEAPTPEPEVVLLSLSAEFDNFKTDYVYGEELSYEGLILTAYYSDDTKRLVSLDECTYTQRVNMNVTADYTLTVTFEGCTIKIDITVRPDDFTRGAEICENDDFDYMITKKGVYITAYKGNATSLNLDEIDGESVIAIGEGVFADKDIESVQAQNCQIIFDNAFKDCDKLIDCFTPNAVSVGNSAFENCSSLREASFSPELYLMGERAYRCTSIKELVLPESITTVPEKLCQDCFELEKVEMLGAVSEIGDDAFNSCTKLTSLTGTALVEKVGERAFFDDKLLNIDKPFDKLKYVGAYAFSNCNAMDIGKLPKLLKFGEGSFEYCYLLTEVSIVGGTTVIPDNAFIGTRLTKVTLPQSVKRIGNYAFAATQISEITLPRNLEYIGNMGLHSTRMRNVYFPKRDVKMEDNAFYIGSRLKFYVYENSSAHKYAVDNNISYEFIEDDYHIPVYDGEDD